MKILTSFMLTGLALFSASFKASQQTENLHFKNEGYFTASIDGKPFDSRRQDRYTAAVINTGADGKTGADLTFYGNDYMDENGNAFQESLEFKYAFSEAAVGNVSGQKIVFQFNNQKFLSIPGETQIKVTKVKYNADRSAFTMSAEFRGKMLMWKGPGQDQPIVTVKGKMEDINVSAPASAVQTAS